MASSPDVDADSRTSGVGRKRALQETLEHENSATLESSDEGSTQQLHKRRKPNEEEPQQPDEVPFLEPVPDTVDEKVLSPAGFTSSLGSENVQSSTEKAGQSPSTWNQGVQSGLRTSFAGRRSTRSLATIPLVVDEGQGGEHLKMPSPEQEQPSEMGKTSSQQVREDEMDKDMANAIVDEEDRGPKTKKARTKEPRVVDEQNKKLSKKQTKRYLKAMTALREQDLAQGVARPFAQLRTAALIAAKDLITISGSASPVDAASGPPTATDPLLAPILSDVIDGYQTGAGRTIPYNNSLGSMIVRQIFSTTGIPEPIHANKLTFPLFAKFFLVDNLDLIRNNFKAVGHRTFAGAFSIYLETFHKALGKGPMQKKRKESKSDSNQKYIKELLRSIEKSTHSPGVSGLSITTTDLIPKSKASGEVHQAPQKSLEDRIVSANSSGHLLGDKRLQSKASAEVDLTLDLASKEPTTVGDDFEHQSSTSTKQRITETAVSLSDNGNLEANRDISTSVTSTTTATPAESGSGIMDIEAHVSDEVEVELQQKYFPTPRGENAVHRCLACARSGHTSRDCPALHCFKCGITGSHSTLSCPQNQRCSKCRQRGHSQPECPEKLFVSQAEAGACDFCASTGHMEIACPLIWRSFDLKPEEIRKVRDIPINCYCCGGSGHFGPECGLNNRLALSGDRTWSKENWKQYIDFNSKERAISAGVDYSMPPKKRKDFSIRGKASNPIDLDDSDDDEPSFIRPRINTGPQERGPIRFGGYGNNSYAPDIDAPHDRPLRYQADPPRAARITPSYDSYQPRDESSRYGRERSFSPPPRYNDGPRRMPQHENSYHSNLQDPRYADERSSGYAQPPDLGPIDFGTGLRAPRGGGRGKGRAGGYVNSAPRASQRPPAAEEKPPRGQRKPRASKGDRRKN